MRVQPLLEPDEHRLEQVPDVSRPEDLVAEAPQEAGLGERLRSVVVQWHRLSSKSESA